MADIADVIARELDERLAYHRKLGARKAGVMAVGNTVTVWVSKISLPTAKPKARRVT